MNSSNRRKHPRAVVNLLVGETTGGRYFLPLLTNISEEGILLESPVGIERPWDHDPIVEIALPGSTQLVWARCRMVRNERQGFFQEHALRFVNISAVDRMQIRWYVQRRVGIA